MTVALNPDDPVFYVYILADPRKIGTFTYGKYSFPYEPFYIGKGKGDRYKSHRLRSNLAVRNKIASIKRKTGKSHKYKIYLRGLTEQQAYKLEQKLITAIGLRLSNSGPLLNMNLGGPGVQQGYVSEATRERRAKALKAYWARVRKDKAALEQRTRNMGRSWTTKQRKEQSKIKRELYRSKEGVAVKRKLARSVRRIAAARTPAEVKRIYDKQRATRKANKVLRSD